MSSVSSMNTACSLRICLPECHAHTEICRGRQQFRVCLRTLLSIFRSRVDTIRATLIWMGCRRPASRTECLPVRNVLAVGGPPVMTRSYSFLQSETESSYGQIITERNDTPAGSNGNRQLCCGCGYRLCLPVPGSSSGRDFELCHLDCVRAPGSGRCHPRSQDKL